MRLNADASFVYFLVLGRAYWVQGDVEQAAINLKEAVRRNASDLETRVYMAAIFVAAGDLAGKAEEIHVLQTDFSLTQWLSTSPISDNRHKEQLRTLLGKVGL